MAKAPKAKKIDLVIEGDSWERLPDWWPGTLPTVGGSDYDLTRALKARGLKVESYAHWGDTIASIAKTQEYLQALREYRPGHFLLGGGGNDFLGEGRLKRYLNIFDPSLAAKDYLKPNFFADLAKAMNAYARVLKDISKVPEIAATKVIVHGYDYARPMSLLWIGEPMKEQGIDNGGEKLMRGVVKALIDAFNIELKAFAAKTPNVIYVNLRNTVKDDWHDELHPNKAAFERCAAKIAAAM